MMRREEEDDPQVRVLHELSSMILHILNTPPLITLPFTALEIPSSSINPTSWRVSPVMFAALFLGISVALMLFGSIIFVIGLILLPWIIALSLIFYFAGIFSTLLGFGHAFLCWAVSPRDVPGNSSFLNSYLYSQNTRNISLFS